MAARKGSILSDEHILKECAHYRPIPMKLAARIIDGNSVVAKESPFTNKKLKYQRQMYRRTTYITMENGDALYACIAKVEKENEKLKKENKESLTLTFLKEELEWAKEWSDDKWDDFKRFVDNSDSIYEIVKNDLLKQLMDDFIDEKNREEEEEVLEDLTCDQLKTRLRAINKPVSGRKADLIKRIREHERLTAALFEED